MTDMCEGLWVDDERPLPAQYQGWLIARSYQEAIGLLSSNRIRCVSLDHDLASYEDGRERTGYDIAVWLAERKTASTYQNKYGRTVPTLLARTV